MSTHNLTEVNGGAIILALVDELRRTRAERDDLAAELGRVSEARDLAKADLGRAQLAYEIASQDIRRARLSVDALNAFADELLSKLNSAEARVRDLEK